MAKKKTRQTEIYQLPDGFYAGVMDDEGRMEPGAYRLTDEDIMTMSTALMKKHCTENGTDRLLMKDSDGDYFVMLRVPARQAAAPAEGKKGKAPARKAPARKKKE
jgi:hypothetical protein